MNTEELNVFQSKLIELLTELETQMEQSREERAPVAVDGRMGRVSRADEMQVQQMAMEMGRRREQRISRVRTALERIKDGSYGVCGRCEKPISEARLSAMPEVVLCVRCAAGSKTV